MSFKCLILVARWIQFVRYLVPVLFVKLEAIVITYASQPTFLLKPILLLEIAELAQVLKHPGLAVLL